MVDSGSNAICTLLQDLEGWSVLAKIDPVESGRIEQALQFARPPPPQHALCTAVDKPGLAPVKWFGRSLDKSFRPKWAGVFIVAQAVAGLSGAATASRISSPSHAEAPVVHLTLRNNAQT